MGASMTDKNIYQRINAVRKEKGYVQKDAVVQGYKAVTHDNVTAMLRENMIKQGIIVIPTLVRSAVIDAGQTKNGATIIRYEASYQVSFVNEDDPSDKIDMTVEAHANDMGDKAPGKCLSYAVKYALLKIFSLETGENEESRVEGQNSMTKRLVSEAQDYLDSGDCVALALFERDIGEAMTDVYNAAPDGKKTEWKKDISNSIKTGHTILKQINTAILTDDAGAAAENVHDMTPGGKRLLHQYLGGEKSVKLGELIKSIQTGD